MHLVGGGQGLQNILILGHGGGTMAADLLLTSPPDVGLNVTAVESDSDVAEAAQQYFHPNMFAHSEPGVASRLSVVQADAVDLVSSAAAGVADGACALRTGAYDVILEDFAYERPGWLRAPFWRSLRALAAPGGHLVVNTLYDHAQQMADLEEELQAAGWSDVRKHVDRGLQAELGERRRSTDPSTWQFRDNMIFDAVNRR